MPKLPQSSPFITNVHTAKLSIPPDAIVVRGYLGPPRGVLEHAAAILAAFGKTIPAGHFTAVNDFHRDDPSAPWPTRPAASQGQPRQAPLADLSDGSPRLLDRGPQLAHQRRPCAAGEQHRSTRRVHGLAAAVHGRRQVLPDPLPRRRRVVGLEKDDGFLAGRLVEDYDGSQRVERPGVGGAGIRLAADRGVRGGTAGDPPSRRLIRMTLAWANTRTAIGIASRPGGAVRSSSRSRPMPTPRRTSAARRTSSASWNTGFRRPVSVAPRLIRVERGRGRPAPGGDRAVRTSRAGRSRAGLLDVGLRRGARRGPGGPAPGGAGRGPRELGAPGSGPDPCTARRRATCPASAPAPWSSSSSSRAPRRSATTSTGCACPLSRGRSSTGTCGWRTSWSAARRGCGWWTGSSRAPERARGTSRSRWRASWGPGSRRSRRSPPCPRNACCARPRLLPLAGIRPGLAALWLAYADEAPGGVLRRRCLELAAVRLVHLALETACEVGGPPRRVGHPPPARPQRARSAGRARRRAARAAPRRWLTPRSIRWPRPSTPWKSSAFHQLLAGGRPDTTCPRPCAVSRRPRDIARR